jgi:hypothetical protein
MNPVGQEGNIFSNLFDKVPAKRAGNEEDLVGSVLYLSSRAGVSHAPLDSEMALTNLQQAYVDGINLCVDGGRVLLANGQE